MVGAMTDGVSNNTPGPDPASTALARRPRVYQTEGVREVQARARVLEQRQSDEERQGVQRLDRLMKQVGQPEGDVPRGFYLNIQV